MNTTLHLKNKISFEEFAIWRETCRLKGEKLVDTALRDAAMNKGVALLANPTNPVSFAHFIRPDVQSKECTIRERTLQEGIGKGFLPPTNFFSERKLTFIIEDAIFYATQNGYLVKSMGLLDLPIKVASYKEGSYIVSDIDLLFIGSKIRSNEILFDKEYGEITSFEKEVVLVINEYFQNLVVSEFLYDSHFKLIAHGPANRFSRSKFSHIHYPISVYEPNGKMFLLNNFEELMGYIKNNELQFSWNKSWDI